MEQWKVTVTVEQDGQVVDVLFYKVYAKDAVEAEKEMGWRLEFLTGVPYRIAEIVNTKDLVYGDS